MVCQHQSVDEPSAVLIVWEGARRLVLLHVRKSDVKLHEVPLPRSKE